MTEAATTPERTGVATRARLAIELIGLYWVMPWFIDFTQRWQGALLIPGLVVVGALLFVWLWFDKRFDRRSLWNFGAFRRELGRICVTAAIAFASMVLISIWLASREWSSIDGPDLGFLRFWPVLVLYPLFSVYPQEIILRTFFFHRYRPIIGTGRGAIVASALTFAWVHVLFVADRSDPYHWIPVYLCVPSGLLFGYTYWKTKSTIASGFEHALVGNLMWISGLGWYFYAGGAVANGG